MVIPIPIYEKLPYVYMAIGLTLIISDLQFYARVAGVLIYCSGCCYWVQRSNYRRDDRYSMQAQQRTFSLPALVYETLPFLYILFGVLILLLFGMGWELIPGLLLLGAGMLVWRLRHASRLEEPPKMVLRRKRHTTKPPPSDNHQTRR